MKRDADGFNACIIERELKVVSVEFGFMIMEDLGRVRVAREPAIFEETSDVFSCFGAWNTNDFNKVGNWVNACESIKAKFDFVDFNIPLTNAINVYFRPRGDGC